MRDSMMQDPTSFFPGQDETNEPEMAETMVQWAKQEEMRKQENGQSTPQALPHPTNNHASSSNTFSFSFPPPSSSSSSSSHAGPPPHATPIKRRPGAPGSIPNFPSSSSSSSEPRDPAPQIPFSPSPTASPKASSPFRSPLTPLSQPRSTGGGGAPSFMPLSVGTSSHAQSPWLALAASSGAPTPSLDGPGGGAVGRSSPHLGYPFEQLNIGGSWSGANLFSSEPEKSRAMSGGAAADTSMDVDPTASAPAKSLPLPAALAKRRGSLPKAGSLGGALSLPPMAGGGRTTKSPSPLASSSTPNLPATSASSSLTSRPLAASAVPGLATQSSTLILDLRPPSSFASCHLPTAHSIPIPSTLLRRPAFTLQKLSSMLTPPTSTAIDKWRDMSDVVLVDVDSVSAPNGSVLDGLASKFAREGFAGKVWYVKGGMKALEEVKGVSLVSDEGEPENGEEEREEKSGGGLMARRLGSLAFQQGSTGSKRQVTAPPKLHNLPMHTPGVIFRADPFGSSNDQAFAGTADPSSSSSLTGLNLHSFNASMPNLSASAPSMSMSQSSSSLRASSTSSRTAKPKLQPANPFFDNIRQNLELSHGGITERIPLGLPEHMTRRASELPSWLGGLVEMSDEDGAARLAEEFYKIELGEQKRLQAVMDWHSKGSGGYLQSYGKGNRQGDERRPSATQTQWDGQEVKRLEDWGAKTSTTEREGDEYFPFSITAGVERGTKNRYKNIWPYDFSRVRLASPCDDESDYINASFVQPRGTTRRYIATQGPLDATYRDFWTLIWEQDVRVIVMLTKQYEGGMIKCGNYWCDQTYGSLLLHLVSQTGGEDHAQPSQVSGFDFGPTASTPGSKDDSSENIKRVFELSDSRTGNKRTIVQIQCTAWPDFDVPDSPTVLLSLMSDVDAAVNETCHCSETADRSQVPPVLVHCSAGIGRTGSYILVDSIVDGLRRERLAKVQEAASSDQHQPGGIVASPRRATRPRHGPAPLPFSANMSSRTLKTKPSLSKTGTNSSSTPKRERDSSTRSQRSNGSGSSGGAHTSASLKSVSFLPIPDRQGSNINMRRTASGDGGGTLSHVFMASPSALSPVPGSSASPAVVSPLDDRTDTDSMDLDDGDDEDEPVQGDGAFMRHRGSITASVDSDDAGFFGSMSAGRRPSLGSVQTSDDRVPSIASSNAAPHPEDLSTPPLITKSGARHRAPSPISSLDGTKGSPVQAVLEGMRVQRMSLVQSLRQYLFVHRAIIAYYLNMIDSETTAGAPSLTHSDSAEDTFERSRSGTTTSTTDDEASATKRRASPTDLRPRMELEEETAVKREGDDSVTLAKRKSFKKMKSGDSKGPTTTTTKMEGGGGQGESGGGGGDDGEGPPVKRRGSRLGLLGGTGEVGH